MNWNLKSSTVWDWGNLSTACPNATESFMSGSLLKPRDVDVGATAHGSVNYSDATFTSSSELGHGSSKRSVSASTGSPFKEGIASEFIFTAVCGEAGRVEDSGTSEPSMMAVCHGEPLISLKLGKRAYSKNVCEEKDAKHCATTGTTSASTVVKKTKVSQKSIRNSYCQVEGCNVDLSSAKDYHRKHRVCEAHSKSPKVIVAGLERRFCQQCSRLHGLAEFDQNKRSCRRRLSHHNARRRKPQTDAISFGSPRLSTMLYNNPRQQANLFFHEPPFNQVSGVNAVSSWDNLEGFRFTKTRFPLVQPTKMLRFDETHFPTSQIPNTVVAHAVHHQDLDGLMSAKGTNIKVFNQGVEGSAIISKLNGAPVTERALSLLSDDSWASSSPTVIQQSSSHVHAGATPPLGGFWQDPPPLDEPWQIQAFPHL